MNNLQKDIEKAARKIFKLFFGSRLYLGIKKKNIKEDLLGVDLTLNVDGNKRLSFFMEKSTLRSVKNRLFGDREKEQWEDVSYDILGEMASMILGYALKDNKEDIDISGPIKSTVLSSHDMNTLYFSSAMGKFAIAIEDI
ncbi:MAG: hypothetical protein SVR08_07120 [Spirochaetota bacterium]|nr:hypothetical protein [Spirochaetota bacterium]